MNKSTSPFLYNGFFQINKPKDWTSFKVVDYIKRKFKFKKVGHAGTLDPFATGLLVILVNNYTKKFSDFLKFDKEYNALVQLGKITDTYDIDGKVIEEYKDKIKIDKKSILKTIKLFEGEIIQKPPAFSALKVSGTPAYKLARQGKDVDLASRIVVIKNINLIDVNKDSFSINVLCSSGTYIRSLAFDIGKSLKYGGYLSNLERIRIGDYRLTDAKELDKITIEDLHVMKDFGLNI
ncbi:tRNA pseudouridine(55) synthase TruB [bacterium CG2_30_33_46]|nr:MAG: tRNA pseudouridine(55) synthase TruB [bacterium CG2_30_33_46]